MPELELLKEVTQLRDIWPHEALDFTPWLAEEDNLNLLADALGIEMTADETESAVGDFSVDIVATEVGTGKKIIIENQLEDTNHDHLGKLITYASGKGASTIIWVVKHAREEHRAAIEWLNNHTDDEVGFFLCEIHLYCIGSSKPAVKFEVIEKPNDWTKTVKKKESISPVEQFRLEYWTTFNEYAFASAKFAHTFNRRKPTTDHWMTLSIGSSACAISMNLVRKDSSLVVELYIHDDKVLFKSLLSHRELIESEIGAPLDWRELPDKKASRILLTKPVNFDNQAEWTHQFDWLMNTTMSFRRAFKKHL
jgi:hypothetical protein